MKRRWLLIWAALGCTLYAQDQPLVRFAVLSDIQYADKDTAGTRDYRASIDKLTRAADDLNTRQLAFAIQLGDLIDESAANLDPILAAYERITTKKRHVIGNHDAAAIDRRELLKRLGLTNSFYEFAEAGWRFIVLDSADLSVAGGWPEQSEHFTLAVKMLEELKAAKAPNAQEWNGGVGERQMKWLTSALLRAKQKKERVIVFGHPPILASASTSAHLMWNYLAVRQTLEASGVVAAYFCGHDHNGGYAISRRIHHVTMPGIVEAPEPTYAVVELHPDRLEIRGSGRAPTRTLKTVGR
ncbi:MAG: metallophosphoesterase [Acidobacteriales bacterium]|nr:metallophosphoesterase [Terriglobales bacterium]